MHNARQACDGRSAGASRGAFWTMTPGGPAFWTSTAETSGGAVLWTPTTEKPGGPAFWTSTAETSGGAAL